MQYELTVYLSIDVYTYAPKFEDVARKIDTCAAGYSTLH